MLPEPMELPIRYQEIPEFDQGSECVVQLEAEVRDYEVFYPIAVVTRSVDEIGIDSNPLILSEDGTTSREHLITDGWQVKEIVEDETL